MCFIAGNARKQMAPEQQEHAAGMPHLCTIWKDRKKGQEKRKHMCSCLGESKRKGKE